MQVRAGILRAVAAPKQFLWAPFEMAIINIVMAFVMMLVLIGVLRINPILGMIPLVLGHAGLVVLGAREPHLTAQLRCRVQYPFRRANLAPTSVGAKFVP